MKKLLAIGLAAMMVAGTLASSAFALDIKTDAEVAADAFEGCENVLIDRFTD